MAGQSAVKARWLCEGSGHFDRLNAGRVRGRLINSWTAEFSAFKGEVKMRRYGFLVVAIVFVPLFLLGSNSILAKTYTSLRVSTSDETLTLSQSGVFFYTRTRDGVVRVSSMGSKEIIINQTIGHGLEILDNKIYINNQTYGASILVYDLKGNYLRTIPTPPQASQYLDFVALPDGRIALMDNINDRIYFVNSSGNLLATTNILNSPDNLLQNLDGIVVNNQLVFSDDGKKRILKIDLNTYQKTIFRDLTSLPGAWLGAITYTDGQYYLATSRTIYRFSETSPVVEIATIPEYNITGLVVIDNFAYASTNFAGKIYKVDLNSGSSSVLTSGLNYPRDLEQVGFDPIVNEARLDIGMPYNTNRGCSSPYAGCGGPFHGFYAGVCTDLAMDAYNAGALFNIQNHLYQDHLANPGRYRYGTARNAEDMRRYFNNNQQLLPHSQPSQPGDIAFFDWNGDGITNHVLIISEVDGNGRPTKMVDASGVIPDINPTGRAFEHNWSSYYEQRVQGHARLSAMPPQINQVLAESVQFLRVTVNTGFVNLSLFDANGKSVSATYDENLVALNIENAIPYISGGSYGNLGAQKMITVTWPLTNNNHYFAVVEGQANTAYSLLVETLQGDTVTAAQTFMATINSGVTHQTALIVSAPGGNITFEAEAPTLSATPGAPDTLALSALVGKTAQLTFLVSETNGQQGINNATITATNLATQYGIQIPADWLIITPVNFTVAPGGSQQLTMQVDLNGVLPGVYHGSLLLTSENSSPVMIPVMLEVQYHQLFLSLITRN